MSDISVHIFVQNLRELMKSQHPKIAGEKDQLECLCKDVFLMSSFLKFKEEKCSFADWKVNNLVTEIRELVLEAENIVDRFVVYEPSLDLRSLQKQIEKVKIEVDQMNAAFDQSIVVGDVGKKIQKKVASRERSRDNLECAVGMDGTVDKILAGFDGDREREVISVVGLPGIGKTTLVEKVFEHSRTRSSFQVRAWVTVSQTYSSKQLLIDILQSSSLCEDVDADSSEDRLGEDLLKRLKDKKYLIVLDDIWSIEAWNSIQRSFPCNRNGSKVICTSRFAAIGKDVCHDINTHNVSGLSEEHSWNLLRNKVFGSEDCPPELERFGRKIAKKCDGLPLAIVVIGGILANKDKTTEQWEQVATRLTPAIATDREAYMDTLALSYQHLPLHLRACFLYLGSIFPEDYQIPVRRLVWLLVAEGFSIQENNDDQQIQSSEDTVEGYLNELVERSLVTIASKRPCGATKTIRIHDLLRDFCLVQGEKEKFTLKFKGFNTDVPSLESAEKGQRRFLVSSTNVFPKRSTSNLRSLFLSCYYTIRRESAHVFEQSFRLLKVLQVDRSLWRISNNFENLSSLRYLALLFSFDQPDAVFTSSVTKLLYLETLFLRTKETINMPDDIWNMVKLRHLYNADKKGMFHFNSCPYQGAERRLLDLQTLHTLCSCQSCLENLVRIPNLKKLGLSGCFTIPDLGFLEQLVTLKVANNRILFSPRSSPLFKYKLPASLRKLTLEYTLLKWEEISVLAELENLEVLKLLDRACEDTEAWDTSDLEFPKLKYLKMRRLDIVKWDDSNLQFESLEVLVLENCRRLESIPFDLALSPSLHTMKVTRCNTLVERLAKDIEAEHESQCGNSDLQVVIKSFVNGGESSHILRIFDEEAQAMESARSSSRMLEESYATGVAILAQYAGQNERLKIMESSSKKVSASTERQSIRLENLEALKEQTQEEIQRILNEMDVLQQLLKLNEQKLDLEIQILIGLQELAASTTKKKEDDVPPLTMKRPREDKDDAV